LDALLYRASSITKDLGPLSGRAAFSFGDADATLTEILGPLTQASEGQTMPVGCLWDACGMPWAFGIPHHRTLRPPSLTDGLFFDPPAVPLISINILVSEEHSVRVTPLWCHIMEGT
jgi:hypothetical protein